MLESHGILFHFAVSVCLYVFDFVCLFNLFKLMHIYLTMYVTEKEGQTRFVDI